MARHSRVLFHGRARFGAGAILVALLSGAPAADAGFRVGRDFFDRTSHDLIDFETRADGTPLNLDEGDVGVVPKNEYPGLAFVVSSGFWGNDPDDDVEAALAIAGSLQHSLFILPSSNDPPRMSFSRAVPNVHAVGLSVFYNRAFGDQPPLITVFGPNLLVLDVIDFNDILEGSIGDIDYGFLGYASEHRILGLEFSTTDFVQFDDLRRSAVPAPGVALALVIGGALGARRERSR